MTMRIFGIIWHAPLIAMSACYAASLWLVPYGIETVLWGFGDLPGSIVVEFSVLFAADPGSRRGPPSVGTDLVREAAKLTVVMFTSKRPSMGAARTSSLCCLVARARAARRFF